MRRLVAVAPFVLLLALVAACGGGESGFPGETWKLDWSDGGGIVLVSSSLTLDSDGKIATAGGRPRQTKDGKVDAADLSKLRDLMRSADLPALSTRKLNPRCMDCYSTLLTVTSNSKTYRVAYMDDGPQPAEVKLFDAVYALYKSFDPVATSAAVWPADAWQLEYNKMGGLIGYNQRLTVDSKGAVVGEDRRANRTRQDTLTQSDIAKLLDVIRKAGLPALKSDQGFPVPDAIVVSLRVTSGTTSYGATLNKLPDAADVKSLLVLLEALIYEYTKP